MPKRPEPPTLDEYLAAQIEWAEYSDRFWTNYAEYKVSVNNRLAKRSGAIEQSLKTRPDWPQLREILLAHDNPSVRMIAAHDLHDEDPERALAIWAEIEHGPYGRLS